MVLRRTGDPGEVVAMNIGDASSGLAIDQRGGPGGVVVLGVAGYVDLSNAHLLGGAISAALDGGAGELVIDLDAVTFLDSSGLREFVIGYRQAQAGGHGYRVTGAREHVRQVLEISGMWEYLTDGLPAPPDGRPAAASAPTDRP